MKNDSRNIDEIIRDVAVKHGRLIAEGDEEKANLYTGVAVAALFAFVKESGMRDIIRDMRGVLDDYQQRNRVLHGDDCSVTSDVIARADALLKDGGQ